MFSNSYKIFILSSITLILIYCCKDKSQKTNIKSSKIEIKTATKNNNKFNSEYYYVNTKSGLYFREKPKGKILGKFPINTEIKVIEHTHIFEEILDEGKIRKGEWLGVEKELDTVYVFSSFLSNHITVSNLRLFYATPYYKVNKDIREGFVNISDAYFKNYDDKRDRLIDTKYLENSKNEILFDQKIKNKILKKTNIFNDDSLFIFNFKVDSIYKFKISNLATIAYINAFSFGKNKLDNFDYEVGFNLKNFYKESGEALAFIGKTNPFQSGKLKPIIWTETKQNTFPKTNNIIEKNLIIGTYTFSYKKYKYFIQSYRSEKNNSSEIKKHHLIIKDTESNTIISELFYKSGESIFLNPLSTLNNKIDYFNNWTGEIFKNKPPIIYGLESYSFGCPKIDFIENTESPITILCDNRH
ncbi:hypothetical protein [Polaribacter aestuariivivens]|uniref:hypothetical protein n=1 Tax=Polaribacter aestuariivivens TaxID=2304626 RepID=UPI003F492501